MKSFFTILFAGISNFFIELWKDGNIFAVTVWIILKVLSLVTYFVLVVNNLKVLDSPLDQLEQELGWCEEEIVYLVGYHNHY